MNAWRKDEIIKESKKEGRWILQVIKVLIIIAIASTDIYYINLFNY